ncbi:DnaJ domain-containing protein [Filimonas lacunae]|uniref:DnaJ domain-containing protein n=1 Tax=Filimonas lacunae TaxID=477680 RepID=A0A173MCP8_9BACT|nr:KTSC domain-containing protein [Filimonas lacunae]BAV05354.1 chaperone protein dnaJ [Filimonas lacunae]SIT21798.1 DnaJ domain-containing protein [Filimonas lacunae]
MKRISNYRKLLNVTQDTDLKELKSVYRNLMKEWHPDKFNDNEEAKLEAEEKSKELIKAYHFLVSIAPETIEQALPEYTATISSSQVMDFKYEKQILTIQFVDGSSYEYFGVQKNTYVKLCQTDIPDRFCRRHIYHEYIYRKVSKASEEA